MNGLPTKYKIYIGFAVWLLLCLGMFFYGFNILYSSDTKIADAINSKHKELVTLDAEQQSYQQAKNDLDKLQKQPLQPEQFFSKDITLVNEIKTLETEAQQMGVVIKLGNLKGTVDTATKAKTKSSIYVVPFSLSVTGPYSGVVRYIEVLENLPFITNVNSLSINASKDIQVNSVLNASFYLKKE